MTCLQQRPVDVREDDEGAQRLREEGTLGGEEEEELSADSG